MDAIWLKGLIDLGSLALVGWFLHWLLAKEMPRLHKIQAETIEGMKRDFLAELAQDRMQFHAAIQTIADKISPCKWEPNQ